MTATAQALRPPSRTLLLLEGRALQELGAFMLLRPWLAAAPRGDGHPVLVLPGLLASDFSTQPLRSFLKAQGYAVHGWKQGRNLGLRPGVEPDMLERVEELHDRHGGRKLSLVGWSLGGIYARQLAKLLPDKVRCVISLGSPFAGSPKATNAWKVYEFASGQSVEDRDGHIAGPLAEPPPVPTTSIFSRSDGICAWQTCVNEEREQVENIEVYGSHCGLGHHPAAVYAVADRLAQPEGQWKKFDRSGWKSIVFPDWRAGLEARGPLEVLHLLLDAGADLLVGVLHPVLHDLERLGGRLLHQFGDVTRVGNRCLHRLLREFGLFGHDVLRAAARLVLLHHGRDVLHGRLEDRALLIGNLLGAARHRLPRLGHGLQVLLLMLHDLRHVEGRDF
jgi:pimeloyl-ACP methyl ester carboxylesterase